MNVLILGGTRFLGRHVAQKLAERGHRVTLFHRGENEPAGLGPAEHIHGDRNADLGRLGERHFDAVVDTSAYTPGTVDRAIERFGGRDLRYLFVSTVSVYASPGKGGAPVNESSPRQSLPESASATEMVPETYGALKALCEDRIAAAFGEKATIVRPGLIVGPFDPTDRFTYWPVRFAEGGDVLAPGPPERVTQFIDARDLADFCVRLLEEDASGTFNAVCPPGMVTFGDVFDACARAANTGARPVWVDDAFLLRHDVGPWMELPLWIPGDEDAWLSHVDSSRARAAGLRARPVFETVVDTLGWARGMKRDEMKAGLKTEREAALLRDWHGRT